MIDLNHGSGAQYAPSRPTPDITAALSAAIDTGLSARQRRLSVRAAMSARPGLGRACLRQIQYDYLAVPKDEGQEFAPKTLRIFEAGHRGEDLVASWLRLAGFDLRTERDDGRQFGFTALGGRFKGHIDGCLVGGPVEMAYPALWETKALGVSSWKDTVKRGVAVSKPVYAAQIALYQAYLDLPNPALFTALNRDTMEIYAELMPFDAALAQQMSDRAVAVVRRPMHRNCCRARRPSPPPWFARGAWPRAIGIRPVPGPSGAGGQVMIPYAYEFKRLAPQLRLKSTYGFFLEGVEAAPVYYFADQAAFDSDDIEGLEPPDYG